MFYVFLKNGFDPFKQLKIYLERKQHNISM